MIKENTNAVIFGLAGLEITDEERKFFTKSKPLGFILFARNIDNPEQVKSLVADLRSCVGWQCPILIDQEGGRVARLKPPHWRVWPPMAKFANMANDNIEQAGSEAYANAKDIGNELAKLGINVDCAPVCDILIEGADDIVGDRSFGSDIDIVTALARKTAEGLIDSGVLPIIKHIPGHGRAKADSHKELPLVASDIDELRRTDFKVFQNLAKIDWKVKPWAMTAHILYSAIDDKNPATLSKKVIGMIRNDIGFDGVLISDDLSMQALSGDYADRTRNSLAAGCDLVLHCNGKMEEMVAIAGAVTKLEGDALKRTRESLAGVV